MDDRFKSYFAKLEALTHEELDRSVEKLVVEENTSIAKLVAHLAEMSERKTALLLGYRGLYDYCIRRLNLSEGAVPARVQVANVCREFPQLLVALAERRVSLTVAGLLAPHLTRDNVDTLIDDCTGKTRQETELYLVALAPKPVFEASIRKVPSPPKSPKVAATIPLPPSRPAAPPTRTKPAPPRVSPTILQPAQPTVFNFRFSADKAFRDKFERLAQVMGFENAEKHMAVVMEKALDVALEHEDPKRRHERRLKRKRADARLSRSNETALEPPKPIGRRMPIDVYDRVHAAGDYRCEFCGPDGTRCTARVVEVDHIKPFGRTPNHDEGSMRLLCPHHNKLEAERVYGKAFIRRRIKERKATRERPTHMR